MYDENGNQVMREEEATKQAHLSNLKDVASSAFMEGLSGLMMGGEVLIAGGNASAVNKDRTNNIGNYFNNNLMEKNYSDFSQEQTERYSQNPVQFIADQISDTTEEGKKAKETVQAYADKVDQGKKLSNSERADIEMNIQEARSAEELYKKYNADIAEDPNADINRAYEDNMAEAQEAINKQIEYNDRQASNVENLSKEYSGETQKLYVDLYNENLKDKGIHAASYKLALFFNLSI